VAKAALRQVALEAQQGAPVPVTAPGAAGELAPGAFAPFDAAQAEPAEASAARAAAIGCERPCSHAPFH